MSGSDERAGWKTMQLERFAATIPTPFAGAFYKVAEPRVADAERVIFGEVDGSPILLCVTNDCATRLIFNDETNGYEEVYLGKLEGGSYIERRKIDVNFPSPPSHLIVFRHEALGELAVEPIDDDDRMAARQVFAAWSGASRAS